MLHAHHSRVHGRGRIGASRRNEALARHGERSPPPLSILSIRLAQLPSQMQITARLAAHIRQPPGLVKPQHPRPRAAPTRYDPILIASVTIAPAQ